MLKKMNDNLKTVKGKKAMSKKGKFITFALILIGVILVELSMYVVPFMEEIKASEGPVFVAGMLLLLASLYFLKQEKE